MSVLKAENVTYVYQSKYQQVKALDGVSCDFEAGKFYAIVGQSGSGKTTLLSMLAGLGTPNEGEVVANGQSVKEFGSERHRRENVSVIYQAFNLFPSLNILENVMYPMMIQKAQSGKAKERAKELLAAVGLEDVDPRKLPAMLSGGQQQRVAIARALVKMPVFLFISFSAMTAYPAANFGAIATNDWENLVAGATQLGNLFAGKPVLSPVDLFLGTGVAGCIGETCKLALIVGGIYLCARGVIKWYLPAIYILVTGLFAVALEGFDFTAFLPSVLSGGLILGAIFMATDYVTTPKSKLGNLIYFAILGLLTAGLRKATQIEVVSFCILLMNFAVFLIDLAIKARPFGFRKPVKRKQDKENRA